MHVLLPETGLVLQDLYGSAPQHLRTMQLACAHSSQIVTDGPAKFTGQLPWWCIS